MKPDLIDASTDWDSALLVADRYTGSSGDYFTQQGKRLLAAFLLMANKERFDLSWIERHLSERKFHELRPLIEEHADPSSPEIRQLYSVLMTNERTRADIFAMAHLFLSKALQPRSWYQL